MNEYYYEILNLTPTSSYKDIAKAFRKLAIQWHPRSHKYCDRIQTQKRFILIFQAYEILGNLERRRQYDSFYLADTYYPVTKESVGSVMGVIRRVDTKNNDQKMCDSSMDFEHEFNNWKLEATQHAMKIGGVPRDVFLKILDPFIVLVRDGIFLSISKLLNQKSFRRSIHF